MVEVTENWFYENKDLEPYEVAEFLEDIVSHEFHLAIDDGSSDEIGRLVCQYFTICSSSDDDATIVAKIQTLPRCDLSLSKVENDEGEMEDVEESHEKNVVKQVEEMDIHNSCKVEETDADGFTIVSRKKK